MDALSMAIGFILGAVTVAVTGIYAFQLAARYQRTGHAEPPPAAEDKNGMPSDPEAAAHRRVLEDTVKRGADEIMLLAEAQGDRITREEAEDQAREMIRLAHGGSQLGGTS